MKANTIGVEIEFTGLTRQQAAEVIAEHFNRDVINNDSAKAVDDRQNREWKIVRDSSIITEGGEQCELVTPILNYGDIESLQEIVRKLRKAGAKVNESCGLHVHIGAAGMTAQAIRNLVNTVASREELFFKALNVDEARKRRYCKPVDERFLKELNAKKPATLDELKKIWYGDNHDHDYHYHESRYHALNLHATFTKGTIEFRWFNGTLHAGEIKTAIQISCALVALAKTAKKAIYKPVSLENAKFAMRTFLTRPQGLNLNGDEFKTLRHHLTKHLEGNAAWRFAVA